jgi:hypothetical protein
VTSIELPIITSDEATESGAPKSNALALLLSIMSCKVSEFRMTKIWILHNGPDGHINIALLVWMEFFLISFLN